MRMNKVSRGRGLYYAGIFVILPLLLGVGVYFLADRRYLLISFAIAVYAMLPFFVRLEKKKMRIQKLVVLAVLTAIAVAGRYAFSMFPNVKPMAAIAIISGVAFDAECGFLVGAFSMLSSNVLFGQGPWTPWQMLAMGLVGFFAGLFLKEEKLKKKGKGVWVLVLCLYGFCSVLISYGGIMNPASLLMASYQINRENLTAIYLSGLPMDLVHAGATVLFLFAGAEPVLKKLDRVKRKFVL